ncbi:nuclear transport factor 2 family protein [Kribbella sp. NPDC005582]|uniref:YybH family protein n=1 Tax=Kribbella sp. NPDC005582 TaxID=3156893 RepID=UPI0033BC855B
MIELADYQFGLGARNRLAEAAQPGRDGALAALETFYYALNQQDLDVLTAVWTDDELVQLNNPLGGILRSRAAVADLYRKVFAGDLRLQVTFGDAATYWHADSVVFAGRETGSYQHPDRGEVPLTIRTTRIFSYDDGRWAQAHHHGSIDDPEALATYQHAVRG